MIRRTTKTTSPTLRPTQTSQKRLTRAELARVAGGFIVDPANPEIRLRISSVDCVGEG